MRGPLCRYDWLARRTNRRVKTQAPLFGAWVMSPESWQTELATRQYRSSGYFWEKICFYDPNWTLETSFFALDSGGTLDLQKWQRWNGSYKFDGSALTFSLPQQPPRIMFVEWISDDVIALQDQNGEVRYYQRKE